MPTAEQGMLPDLLGKSGDLLEMAVDLQDMPAVKQGVLPDPPEKPGGLLKTAEAAKLRVTGEADEMKTAAWKGEEAMHSSQRTEEAAKEKTVAGCQGGAVAGH